MPEGAEVFSDLWDDDVAEAGRVAGRPDEASPDGPPAVEEEDAELAEDNLQPPLRAVPEGENLTQRPVGRTAPRMPSQKEWDEHFLTQIPYRSWCPFCVAAAKPNEAHRQLPPFSRDVPLLVSDDCYLKNAMGDDMMTVLVGKLFPSKAFITVPCDVKGHDEYAAARVSSFF